MVQQQEDLLRWSKHMRGLATLVASPTQLPCGLCDHAVCCLRGRHRRARLSLLFPDFNDQDGRAFRDINRNAG
jgi:hypothetical protein